MGYCPTLDNRTPFRVRALAADDQDGADVLSVIAKLTWAIDAAGRARVARMQAPVRGVPRPMFRAPTASIRYPSDFAADKPGTDVLLVGTAEPPQGSSATEMTVRLGVRGRAASLDKAVRVFGPRVYYRGISGVVPGPPGALAPTPLLWELTYGGVDRSDPAHPVTFRENPVGTGFSRAPESLIGSPAPSIEGPKPMRPAGFAPVPYAFEPRASRAGTQDDAWRRERAPLPPNDRDPRYASWAPDDQWLAAPLDGDETITILGVRPDGAPLSFALPRYAPVFESVVLGQTRAHPTHLDTYLVDTDESRVELTFRVKIPIPAREHQLEVVRIMGTCSARALPREAAEGGTA